MCIEERNANSYWTMTLCPWVLSLSSELARLLPSDPASFARAVCENASTWTGECRGEDSLCDSVAVDSYMAAVGQPFVEALTTGIIASGDPLPANPGTAGLPCLAEGGAIAQAALGGVAALGGAGGRAGGPFAVRTVPLKSATSYLTDVLQEAAGELAKHGGGGVEQEPEVPRAVLESYIQSRQGVPS